ncbi:aspartate ammonia-lyase [Defluviimonas sp. SAOS-178_SWC]|uniref:aspartate ammonia-lyase n=1 Tax=Defluviimonas sp. SAOS-178_SWC TaxID=3121287 RepID=UPI0032213A04
MLTDNREIASNAETALRTETDSLGSMALPKQSVHGIHTARALLNFPITGVPLGHFPDLVIALAMVKKAAALANRDLGALPDPTAGPIIEVCDEIIAGRHHEHFVVDMIQGGAGTSTNMNANEVIANLALVRMGHAFGDYAHLHPNDHVNRSQSTNDVYPTALRLATLRACAPLRREQERLSAAFAERARAFADILKVGRTQLQDAVPITLGMEFAAFAETIDEDIDRVHQLSDLLKEVNLGGTAVGTGVNTPQGYAALAVKHLSDVSGYDLIEARNRIEASSDLGAFVMFSSALKRIAVKISKICNDLRLLSSGPRAGLGEIHLPAVQAGSSIMPGKVNPVIPEMVNQVAYQVIGNDLTVTLAAEAGQLQLNAMEPVLIFNVLQSIRMLTHAFEVLTDRCISGIEADAARCEELLAGSFVLATALVPFVGYEKAAMIAKLARSSGRSIAEVAVESGVLSAEDIVRTLTPANMLGGPTAAPPTLTKS